LELNVFTTKNYLWIALPGVLLAGLFGWLFIRDGSVPLWLVGAVVVQGLLLAWWQRRAMRVVLQGVEGQPADSESSGWLSWLKRLAVLLLILVLGGVGQGDRSFFVYDFPKSDRENIDKDELAAFKKAAEQFLALDDDQIEALLKTNGLTEITP
jgi:hypothetical protein